MTRLPAFLIITGCLITLFALLKLYQVAMEQEDYIAVRPLSSNGHYSQQRDKMRRQ
jgi:hypothetical protein